MLEDEGSCFVRVAFEADRVLRGSGADLPCQEASVGVVTVVALHQSFVDAVMERAIELLLHFLMATVAEERSLFLHQELALLGVMRIVAVCAVYAILQVSGTREIAVLLAVLVAV